MTLIASVGFADEVIVFSDSRISYQNNIKPPKDELKKIYQLSSHSLISFTTNDVVFTCKLIEKITIFASSRQDKNTSKFLKDITSYAIEAYNKLLISSKPEIIFIYSAMINEPYVVRTNKLIQMLNLHKNNSFIPEKIKTIKITPKNKKTKIPAPTPLLIKQHFPDGRISSTVGWDYTATGSGKDFEKDITEMYPKLFFVPGAQNKGIILCETCKSYLKSANNQTIGGTIQTFIISKEGVKPVMFMEGDIRKQYIDQNGDWVEEDLKSGTIKRAKQN